ncbi:adenine nucleotide alpha hydrolase [Salinibacter grassmerensis]|uniref:adenine nucleotide alpha hydrolase n=1 Tax=Salinibacter grassmerensis TaxID=3040353 RepID=UPI0021E950E2|nr:adenine nucleotide alpha hydrolase [Salinibacter grassmerensis]
MALPRSQDGLVLMWSGGKDAMLALDVLHSQSPRRVGALLTTVTEDRERVTMHGTSLSLLERQADALDLPLHVMRVPPQPPNEVYEARLEAALTPLLETGFSTVVAGDLFLDDVRAYREELIESFGATALFPLWGRDTTWLAQHFSARGYQAVVTTVDTTQLDSSFVGRAYDDAFLEDLPDGVDPCGEQGAFHTFVTDGPPFARPVSVAENGRDTTGRFHTARLRSTREGA